MRSEERLRIKGKTRRGKGAEALFSGSRGACQIDVRQMDCDYYEFLQGNRDALRAWQISGSYLEEYSWAEETAARLLRQPDRPTAFFCTNDTIAAGAMKAAFRAGLRIPEDLAIVGFDDSFISRVVAPELTTVRIDVDQMGRLAAQKLFDLIGGEEIRETQIEIPTELVIRGTT